MELSTSVQPPSDRSDYRYQKTYESFVKWLEVTNNGTLSLDETVMFTYFNELSKTLKCSSLWSMYSQLKKMILHHNNIDISSYNRLKLFLKEKSIGYESKKCKVFSADEIQRFLTEAPDEEYLAMKVNKISRFFFFLCSGGSGLRRTI